MAAHRYWRLTGFCVQGTGPLELSEARLYAGGTPVDTAATITCSFAPVSGSLSDLNDGLATGVAIWAPGAHQSSGFSLTWDLGAGTPSKMDALRLGSGSGVATFPLDVTIQYSDDAVTWNTLQNVVGASYPGPLTLTAEPTAIAADPSYSSVSLLLHGDGVNGSTIFTDSSATPKVVTLYGGAQISTTQSKFGGSSMYFDGSGDYADVAGSADFAFGTGDFTIELFVRTGSGVGGIVLQPNVGGWALLLFGGGLYFQDQYNAHTLIAVAAPPIFDSAQHHIAVTRSVGTNRIFIDGFVQGSAVTDSTNYDLTTAVRIGYNPGALQYFNGYMDDLRITKGVARYTGNFTPPTAPFEGAVYALLPTDKPLPNRWRARSVSPLQFKGSELQVAAAGGHLREHTFFDVYNGGIGIVYGTVKEKSTPVNITLRRRVLLIDESSRITIRETWSDAATGYFEFKGVKQGVPYTTVSYDHLHNYSAQIHDNLLPELLP